MTQDKSQPGSTTALSADALRRHKERSDQMAQELVDSLNRKVAASHKAPVVPFPHKTNLAFREEILREMRKEHPGKSDEELAALADNLI
ncbi:MAG: hypothetical protein ACYDHY_01055 [Acidiferrobacterales bacterium]